MSALPAGRPPRAILLAMVVLGLLALDDVAALVLAATVTAVSGPDLVAGVVSTVLRVAVDGAMARLLWRGSSTGRSIVVVFGTLTVAVTVVTAVVDSAGLDVVWTVATLVLVVVSIALMFTGAARSWCRGGRQDRSADEAREQRRQRRAHLGWGSRVVQALRDDRDARR